MKKIIWIFTILFLISPFIKGGIADEVQTNEQKPKAAPPAGTEAPSTLEVEESPPEDVVFSLIHAFPEAHAERRKKGKVIQANWDQTGFIFEDSPLGAEITLSSDKLVDRKAREAISFTIASGYEASLIFQDVPPGHSLKVFYSWADEAFVGRKPAFAHVEILIGRKTVFEVQTNTKGWKQQAIDLTLPYLLQRHYALSFKVRSVDSLPNKFLLYGYIE